MDWRVAREKLTAVAAAAIAERLKVDTHDIVEIERGIGTDKELIETLANYYRELARNGTLEFSRDNKEYAEYKVSEFFRRSGNPANLYDKRLAQVMYFVLSDGIRLSDVDDFMQWPKGKFRAVMKKKCRMELGDYSRIIIRLGGTPIVK